MRGTNPQNPFEISKLPPKAIRNFQTHTLFNPYLLASSLAPHSRTQMTHNTLLLLLLPALLLVITPSSAYIDENAPTKPPLRPSSFREAPIFRNGIGCPPKASPSSTIHIAMTLDTTYLRGSIAGVLSVLQHAACPENVAFHFLHSSRRRLLLRTVAAVFPDLPFLLYPFDSALVRNKISSSVRTALDQPLNYARIYLADVLPAAVPRVIYLDSDLILVDDVAKLWATPLPSSVLAAPEYCHANFSSYFTRQFWANPSHARALHARARPPCYFNTGVMVIDLARWRAGGYTRRLEYWMEVQKRRRIYELGSLPPFLLVFGGEVEGVEHRWNQHGLGGDNLRGLCRDLHPGPVSLLHWSGKGKPWLRLDSGNPCPLDYLWAPYDLYRHPDLFSDS